MSGYNLERLNFLIVGDNKHMRALVKTILHALGSKSVTEAADGADAFKELRVFPADIIICDWNMSPLDGMDFVRLVRTGGQPQSFRAAHHADRSHRAEPGHGGPGCRRA